LSKQEDFDFVIKTPGISKKVTRPYTTATNLFLRNGKILWWRDRQQRQEHNGYSDCALNGRTADGKYWEADAHEFAGEGRAE
jgi:hypothetical protein